MRRLASVVARLCGDRRGGAGILLAFAAVPLVAAIGLSVDGARGWLFKSRLASAVDAAALAGGRVYASPTRDDDIEMFFRANLPDDFMRAATEPLAIHLNEQARTLVVTAKSRIPTTFMRVVGIDSMAVSASAEVTLESQNIEVAMVLDITGSMALNGGVRINALKEAANDLVEIVVQDEQTPFYSKVGIVPYGMAVNVGPTIAPLVRGTPSSSGTCWDPAPPTCQKYRYIKASNQQYVTTDVHLSTCVTERTGPDAYTDAAPNPATSARIGLHYNPPSGAASSCPSSTIVPLTSNKTDLHTAINGLVASGATGGQIGVAWGWYLVSPNFGSLWPGREGAAYGTPKLIKVVILMTDGEYNTVYYNGNPAKDSLTGTVAAQYRINTNSLNGNPYTQAQTLCDKMKEAGIIVYTVGLDVYDRPDAKNLVSNCAKDPSHVYLPSDETELKVAFRDIAMRVSKLRLSK